MSSWRVTTFLVAVTRHLTKQLWKGAHSLGRQCRWQGSRGGRSAGHSRSHLIASQEAGKMPLPLFSFLSSAEPSSWDSAACSATMFSVASWAHLKVWLLGRSSSCQVGMKVQCHHDWGPSSPGSWLLVRVPSVVSPIRLRVFGTLVLQWGRMGIASKQCSPWLTCLISAPWYIGFVFQTNEFKSCNCYFHYILLRAVLILYSMD